MRVAFTGHRPEQLNIRRNELSKPGQALQDLIWREVSIQEKAGADTFLCGAARGADIICGEIILAEKQTTAPHLKLICATPFREQADRWTFEWKHRYHALLKGADKIVQVCDEYQRGCFHIRNRYLVDHCDLLIAIYNGGDKGGHSVHCQVCKTARQGDRHTQSKHTDSRGNSRKNNRTMTDALAGSCGCFLFPEVIE